MTTLDQPATAPKGLRASPYYMLFVLWLVHLIANVDRFSFGVAMQKIKDDLQFTDAQLGIATSGAFVLAYLSFGLPAARWLDRSNRRNILAAALALWSAMTVACGVANNFAQMVLARFGLGAGEAPCIPAAVSLLGSMFPREQRAPAAGIFNSAAAAAGIIGTPLMGWITDHYGWRWGLVAFGVLGIALAWVVRFTLDEPLRSSAQLGQTQGTEASMGGKDNLWNALKTMYAVRALRHLALAHCLYGIGFFAFGTWLNALLVRKYGMNYTDLGAFQGFAIGSTMALAAVSSGYFCPWLVKRTQNDRWQLYLPASACVLSVPCMVLACAGYSQTVVMLASVGVFFFALTRTAPLVALIMDLLPATMHSTSMVILIIVTNVIGSAVGPYLTGVLSDALTPSLGSAEALRMALLWTAPALCLVGGLLAFRPGPMVARQLAAN